MGGLTERAAASWVAAAVPRWWPRWGLTGLWLAAFAVAFAVDEVTCTPLDPSVCGTDARDALLMALAVATPVLLVWWPRVGAAWGVGFALLSVALSEPGAIQLAFGVHGAACALTLARWRRSRRVQRELVARMAPSTVAAPPVPPHASDPRTEWELLRVLLAAAAVLAAVGMAGWHLQVSRSEARHEARATQTEAIVLANDDAARITVAMRLPSGERHETDLTVWDPEVYPAGATVPVLVDPADESWVRLVAEPRDTTGWLAGAIGGLLLAGVLVARELRRRWALRVLWLGSHPTVEVTIVVRDGDALLFSTDADPASVEPIASISLGGVLSPTDDGSWWMDEDEAWEPTRLHATLARLWRGEDDGAPPPARPEPATVVGDVHDGGWVLLVVDDDTVLVPLAPLQCLTATVPAPATWRRLRDRLRARSGRVDGGAVPAWADAGESVPGVPVAARNAGLSDLPATFRPTPRRRLLGVVCVAAGFVSGPATIVLLAETWGQRLSYPLAGVQLLAVGLLWSSMRLRITDDHLEVATAWRRHLVAWDALHGVRRDGRRLVLAWYLDEVVPLPELAADGFGQERATGRGSWRRGTAADTPADGPAAQDARAAAASEIGGLIEAVRVRRAVGADPDRVERSFRRELWPWFGCYLAVVAVTLWAVAAGLVPAPWP